MKIAVIGGGVSGSYLAQLLKDNHEVVVYERQERDKFFPICAWATSLYEMRQLTRKIGLNFDDYVYYVGKRMYVQVKDEVMAIKLKGLCTFDKLRFIMDMHRDAKVNYGTKITTLPNDDYDIVVEATGFNRIILPKIKKDYFIPTVEYKVKFRDPPFDDFYIKPINKLSGYLWYFPLDGDVYHVGAGDYYKNHEKYLNEFLHEHKGEIIMKIGRPVRITPPHLSKPIINGNIVGVGECIGTVFPILGEGIIPSIHCAKILYENIESENLVKYQEDVMKYFNIFYKLFTFIQKKFSGKFNLLRDVGLLISPIIYMKRREKRFGIEVRLRDWLKIVRSY
ncbi:MAG: NAD(P)/FAD-dependent oxidoreductase [Nitrososphaerota archaeon]